MTTIQTLAEMICIAARTAPKAKGIDNIVTLVVDGKEKDKIVEKMDELGKEREHPGFIRDAKGIRVADTVVFIGTKLGRMNLKICGLCGAANCVDAEEKKTVCIFNPGDLGIAVGSAVSKAADFRLDNRIMYSAGFAAQELGMFDKDVKIVYAISLSVTGKNPFFDRG